MARILIISPPRGSRDGVAAESAQIVEAWEAAGHTVMWVATGAALIGGGERPQSGDAGGQFAVLGMIPRRHLLRRIDAFQPDLLFIQFALASLRLSVFSVLLMALRQKRRGIRVLAGCHEGSRELAILGAPIRWLYRALEHCSTRLVAFSSGEADAMVKHRLATAVTALSLGARTVSVGESDLARISTKYAVERPLVLTVGFVHPDKGTDLLVQAAPLIHERLRGDVEFLIAGEPRPRSGLFRAFARRDERFSHDLQASIESLGSTIRIRRTGFVPDEDVAGLMSLAAVVVLPYRTATQSAIGAWAIASGAAVVASDLPGTRGQLGTAARFFPSGDNRALADAVTAVLTDDSTRRDLRLAASQLAEQQSFPRVAEQLLALGRSAQ